MKRDCPKCKQSNWTAWRIEFFKDLGGSARVRECLTPGCGNGQLSGRIRDPGFLHSVTGLFDVLKGAKK